MRVTKLLFFFLLFLQEATAQPTAIKLLNPDGNPAIQAKMVAIKNRDAIVDPDLNCIPGFVHKSDVDLASRISNVFPDANGNWNVSSNAIGLVASNESGFLFLPSSQAPQTGKLHPWAKLNLRITPEANSLRDQYRLKIVWSNCFAGQWTNPSNKKTTEPDLDWRFDSYIQWMSDLEIKDHSIRVPPGEVSVFLQEHLDGIPCASPIWIGSVRSKSDETSEFAFPKFGSAKLRWRSRNSFPDWNGSEKLPIILVAVGKSTFVPGELKQLLLNLEDDPFGGTTPKSPQEVSIAKEQLARYYSSEEGTRYRFSLMNNRIVTLIDHTGNATFKLIPLEEPVGLFQFRTVFSHGEKACTVVGSSKPRIFQISWNQVNELGDITEADLPSEEATKPIPTVDTHAEQLRKQQAFIANEADRKDWQRQLQQYVESEFDANQAARRTEMKRLKELLDKSQLWLDQRDTNRKQIIDQRIKELLSGT